LSLQRVTITDLRCIEEAELEIPPGLTLLWGDNGSGKTSVLEAIFLLGRGRSFRTRNNERLIHRGSDRLRVIGHVGVDAAAARVIGIEASRSGTEARIAGRSAQSLAELSQAFPVQAIEPGVHRLIEEGGYRRRRWMDWAVFHVEPQFMDTWVRYQRALKQRNAALKGDVSQAGAWDPELARLGEIISASRAAFIERLEPYWRDAMRGLSGGVEASLHYLRGWNLEHSLLEALAASKARDESRKLTHSGPHRADVAVRVHGRPAREVLSRGQQKLVAAAMTLAQLRLLQDQTQTTPTLLLDDPAAELDATRLQGLIAEVSKLRCQLVVTSLHAESRLFGTPERTFCVVQGRVQPV
jgi:DNA replication and repair protein RecF